MAPAGGFGERWLVLGEMGRFGERRLGDWAWVRAGGFGEACVGASRKCGEPRAGAGRRCGEPRVAWAWRLGERLALHEGRFRWGFHRIPYSGEPVP